MFSFLSYVNNEKNREHYTYNIKEDNEMGDYYHVNDKKEKNIEKKTPRKYGK